MSWATLSPELREIIERCCSPLEVEAMKLKATGASPQRIAHLLELRLEAVWELLASVRRKVRAEVAALRGIH